MRTKSFPVRTWNRSSRNSLDPNPSPASLPDGANERVDSGGVSTTHCDPQVDSGDADVENVPDTFDEKDVPHKKRHCLDSARGGSDPLNLDACIVCDISDKRVSRCAGIDCPVSFHGECLNVTEDLASSYCPYCWFKILAVKCKSVRETAVGAEKAVFKYLDRKMKSRDEGKENVPNSQEEDTTLYDDENGNREHSVDSTDIVSDQELQGEKDAYSSRKEQVQVEKDCDRLRGEKMPLAEVSDYQPEEDTEKLEANTDKSGDMKEDNVIDEVEASEEEERANTENFQDAEDDKDGETDKVRQNEKQRRRRLILKDIDSEISSTESTNERDGEDGTEQLTSSQIVTSPSGKMKNQQRKLSTTTNVAKPKTERDILFFSNKDQRRRLFWTSEEEEMLKVGVEKYSAEAKKNMPWRKILEMGEKVFHETRTPSDLKDKWRNMIGKRLRG